MGVKSFPISPSSLPGLCGAEQILTLIHHGQLQSGTSNQPDVCIQTRAESAVFTRDMHHLNPSLAELWCPDLCHAKQLPKSPDPVGKGNPLLTPFTGKRGGSCAIGGERLE